MIISQAASPKIRRYLLIGFCAFIGVIFPLYASAEPGELTLFSIKQTETGQDYTIRLQIVILMTLLSLLPIFILMTTSFVRFIIVLSILRQAMGLQQSPPNRILTGIALALTLLVMKPVGENIYNNAIVPYEMEQITFKEALDIGQQPLKKFMLSQTHKESLEQITTLAEVTAEEPESLNIFVIIPAFILSELKTAFLIGFMLYIPFLIIDMIVASILMAMGMMMLSPLIVSLPFKLMLFVLCNGWGLTVGTLISGIQGT